jgi:hypothetical protein
MHINMRPILAALCLIAPTELLADILSSNLQTPSAQQYSRVDLSVELKANWKDPYDAQEIALDAEFTAPSGKVLRVPAYFAEGKPKAASRWQLRFTPQEAGSYSYVLTLREGKKKPDIFKGKAFSVSSSDAKGFLHPNNHWTFKFDNGDVFRGIGENFCWEFRDVDDSKYFKALHEDKRFTYDQMLPKLAQHQANFVRTWMIYWNLPVDWKTVQNASRYKNSDVRFNESGSERLDQLMEIAEKNNIYLMLALESHVGYMGTGWDTSVYNVKNGGYAATPEEFFSNPKTKQLYKNKLRYMVARWGYSTKIGAWEFFNEIDNVMYAKKDAVIPDAPVTQWHKEMSEYLAEIDPYDHIITTSISHRDVAGLNDIANIHLNQKHIYKATSSIPKVINDYVSRHNKPYAIGESGYEWDWSKNFNEFSENMISDYKRGLWYGLFSPTPILPLSWWWEFFDEKGLTPYFSKVADINRQMLQASSGELMALAINSSNTQVEAFAVKAGKKVFVYLFNPGKTPLTTDLSLTQKAQNAQRFDPDTGVYSTMSSSLQGISLDAMQDAVIILQ